MSSPFPSEVHLQNPTNPVPHFSRRAPLSCFYPTAPQGLPILASFPSPSSGFRVYVRRTLSSLPSVYSTAPEPCYLLRCPQRSFYPQPYTQATDTFTSLCTLRGLLPVTCTQPSGVPFPNYLSQGLRSPFCVQLASLMLQPSPCYTQQSPSARFSIPFLLYSSTHLSPSPLHPRDHPRSRTCAKRWGLHLPSYLSLGIFLALPHPHPGSASPSPALPGLAPSWSQAPPSIPAPVPSEAASWVRKSGSEVPDGPGFPSRMPAAAGPRLPGAPGRRRRRRGRGGRGRGGARGGGVLWKRRRPETRAPARRFRRR